MRATVRNVLVATPTLTAVVPADRWWVPGAVVDNPVKPFVVLRWLAPVAGAARGTFLRQLRVDVHDERGSYKRIDQLLGNPDTGGGVYGVLSSLVQHTGVDGRVTEANYLGHSGDQEDPTYGTNFKFSSWQVIGVDL
jgi:hypothetical protein